MANARACTREMTLALVSIAAVSLPIGGDTFAHAATEPSPSAKADPTAKLHQCASCHGEVGVSTAEIFPNLAGQQKDYIVAQLTAFRDHTRRDRDAKAYMWGFAARLDSAAIQAFAAYYAGQTPARPQVGVKADIAAGEHIFKTGIADRGVLACVSCHGETGEGNGEIPRLAGQHKDYVMVQLKAFASGARDNGAMSLIAKGLTRADIKAVASYIESVS